LAEGGEIITEDELRQLFTEKAHPIAYDGFEPSGKMHLAQGILRATNVNRMTKAGCKFRCLSQTGTHGRTTKWAATSKRYRQWGNI